MMELSQQQRVQLDGLHELCNTTSRFIPQLTQPELKFIYKFTSQFEKTKDAFKYLRKHGFTDLECDTLSTHRRNSRHDLNQIQKSQTATCVALTTTYVARTTTYVSQRAFLTFEEIEVLMDEDE